MRPETYGPDALRSFLEQRKVATMTELKRALGTTSQSTVVRKLNALGYLSSYSHCGKYYTLQEQPRFDSRGLWFFGDVRFSKFGTLKSTVEAFVLDSEGGYFVCELDSILQVSTRKALQALVREKRLSRSRVSGWYVYFSSDSGICKEQLRARRTLEAELMLAHGARIPQVSPDELKAATILVYSTLNEKQRRLCAGLESLRLGYGGDRMIADVLGINVHTVAKGRRELLEQDLDLTRIRSEGAGRKSIKKKRLRSSPRSKR